MEFWTFIGLLAVVLVFLRFVNSLGKSVPILELMLLLAGLQWIVGAFIEYVTPSRHYKYYMYVPEEVYMGYVVPAYLAFAGVVILGLKKVDEVALKIDAFPKVKSYGLKVFLIGVFFDIISGFLPGSLGFFAFIVANFKFAGAIILFFSDDPKLKKIFYGSLAYLFLSALQKAMFHDLILWTVFFYMFWAIKHKPSKQQIYLSIVIGVLSVSTLQTIKAAYRSQVWGGYQGNKLELFANLFIEEMFFSNADEEEEDENLNNVRLNQGWIISAIMDEIPRRVAYLDGATIVEAVMASILPRFLNPDKKKAGGQENFRKFTGLQIADSTSMGISIIGEAYGNFKLAGGILFMAIWGYVIVLVWRPLYRKSLKNIMFLAFLPIIFLQVVKAETELVVVLNHLVKASIVVFLFFWAADRFLQWNVKND